MSISTSFRLFFYTKFPQSLLLLRPTSPISKTLSFFKSISIQRLPTTNPPLSSPPPLPSSSSSSHPSFSLQQPISELPPKLQEIVKLFQAVQQPKVKYEQLLFYGKNLKTLDSQFKTSENRVQGCVSQVWVRAYLDSVRNVVFQADSDSVLTKGLAALLVQGLSGRPVEEIIRVSPDFVVLLGLQQSLTPSRNNGFLNMLKLMQKKALQLYVEAEKGGELSSLSMSAENPVEDLDSGSKVGISIGDLKLGKSEVAADGSDSNSDGLGSRGERIKEKLEAGLSPTELKVDDISYQHAGHEGVRGSDGETHFNVKVVSKEFEGKSLVKRHRLIYDLLQDELQSGLHALSIVAKTPSEVDIK
ncbi:hypothetical protein RHSIM_Rhsim04G0009700 [Rhododendron simsii]|uniref:Fe-S metabolism associated domain-containing protein n=1 Tax=Rhododendron simsii TaxID=118357 RepID=A0A834LPJ2_RHOSS|nr:hypothetical protein RHSIM_Rhsim04G0009700 [Rhododendron simsii]